MSRLKKRVSLFLKYLGITKIRVPRKPSPNLVAENLILFFVYVVTIVSLICMFGIMGISSASSEAEMRLAETYAVYALMIVYAFLFIFELFYIGPKIISKLQNFSPLAQYNVLKIGRKPLFMSLLGTLFLGFLYVLTMLMNATGMQEFTGNEIINKTYHSLLIFCFSLIFVSIPTAMIFSLPLDREREISLNAIRSFEDISKKFKKSDGLTVWKPLVKNIVYWTESFVKQHGISSAKLYRPFNVISLAAIMGNNEQRNRAKEWIAQLGTILTDKEIGEARKAVQILDHMEKVEQEREFTEILQMHEKYGLHYQFKSIWKRIKFGTIEKIILFLVGIGTFIFALIKFLIFRM